MPWQHRCSNITRHLRHPGGQPEPQPPAESVQQLCRPRTHCQGWLDGTVNGQVQHSAVPVSSSRPSCSKLRPGLPGRTNFLASKATTSTFPGPSARQRENVLRLQRTMTQSLVSRTCIGCIVDGCHLKPVSRRVGRSMVDQHVHHGLVALVGCNRQWDDAIQVGQLQRCAKLNERLRHVKLPTLHSHVPVQCTHSTHACTMGSHAISEP